MEAIVQVIGVRLGNVLKTDDGGMGARESVGWDCNTSRVHMSFWNCGMTSGRSAQEGGGTARGGSLQRTWYGNTLLTDLRMSLRPRVKKLFQ